MLKPTKAAGFANSVPLGLEGNERGCGCHPGVYSMKNG